MSFCSYEEAWGAPYNASDSGNKLIEHVEKKKDSISVKKQVLEQKKEPYQNFQDNDLDLKGAELAPLRGELLGGAIPEKQWQTQEPDYSDPVSDFESRFDAKIDKLIDTIESFVKVSKKDHKEIKEKTSNETSWTDVLIFIALGIAAIFLLDMFFKFGKYLVETKIGVQSNRTYSPQMMMPPNYQPYYNYQPPVGGSNQYFSHNNIPAPNI
jgi:hypothetical protein